MGLDCHVISQDHMTKDSSNFIGEPFKLSHHPTKFGDHRHSSSGDMFLVCHMILQDHVIKESCDSLA